MFVCNTVHVTHVLTVHSLNVSQGNKESCTLGIGWRYYDLIVTIPGVNTDTDIDCNTSNNDMIR